MPQWASCQIQPASQDWGRTRECCCLCREELPEPEGRQVKRACRPVSRCLVSMCASLVPLLLLHILPAALTDRRIVPFLPGSQNFACPVCGGPEPTYVLRCYTGILCADRRLHIQTTQPWFRKDNGQDQAAQKYDFFFVGGKWNSPLSVGDIEPSRLDEPPFRLHMCHMIEQFDILHFVDPWRTIHWITPIGRCWCGCSLPKAFRDAQFSGTLQPRGTTQLPTLHYSIYACVNMHNSTR